MTYHGDFSNWNDVQEQFEMNYLEPFKVIYASYSYENYEGDANVLWRNADGTFGYVEGSHCSCYGLEGQWKPESYTADQLRGQVERARYGFFSGNAALILAALPTSEEAGA